MRIAYIEDDRDARQIFASRLKEDGYECDTFDSAEDFFDNAEPGAFDTVVSDIQLPGMTGVDCIKRLRDANVSVPCILITAFNSLEYARSALNANANYLLEKPFTYDALVGVIKKVSSAALTVSHCVQHGLKVLNLTAREKDVAELLLKGLSNSEIAKVVDLSEKTVKQYVTQIFQKAQVRSRSEFFSSIFPV